MYPDGRSRVRFRRSREQPDRNDDGGTGSGQRPGREKTEQLVGFFCRRRQRREAGRERRGGCGAAKSRVLDHDWQHEPKNVFVLAFERPERLFGRTDREKSSGGLVEIGLQRRRHPPDHAVDQSSRTRLHAA